MVFAFLYLSHGLTWLFNAFGGRPIPLTPLLTTAGVIECICGTLMLMGLFTSWAAFIASGEMAVAFWMVHVGIIAAGKQLTVPLNLVPHMNGGIDAVAFCFAFLYIASRGAGLLSVDSAMGKK